MNAYLNRTYRFKFYLNANHYIIIDGVEGETHPHTWEFTVDVIMEGEDFVPFNVYEKDIDAYFDQYQNRIMNEFPPFDVTIPTLENMSEVFVVDIRSIVEKHGGRLVKMESSETPTRSYFLSFEDDEDFLHRRSLRRQQQREKLVKETMAKIL